MRSTQVEVIAEAAQGFEGSPAIARLLVRGAAAAGANAVKFQMVYAAELATPAYPYYDLFKQLEMSDEDWASVADEAASRGIGLIFDIFGMRSLSLACELGGAVKLHSTDFFNDTLVAAAMTRAQRVLISIGGIAVDELDALVARHNGSSVPITIMFGFQAEPTTMQDNQLARLPMLTSRYSGVDFGFMDHSEGESDESGWLGVMAVALGARVIEKHITLDRRLEMEDYVSALSSAELARYVGRIRQAAIALGFPTLELGAAELAYRNRSVKVLVSDLAINAGDVVDAASLSLRRAPLDSSRRPLRHIDEIGGRCARHSIAKDEVIYAEDLQ